MLVTAALALHVALFDPAPPAPAVHIVPSLALAQEWDQTVAPAGRVEPPGRPDRTPVIHASLAAAAGMAGADLSLGGVTLLALLFAALNDSRGAMNVAIAAGVAFALIPPALGVGVARGTVDGRSDFWGPYLAALAVRALGWLGAAAIARNGATSTGNSAVSAAFLLVDLVAVPLTIGWAVTGSASRAPAPPAEPGSRWDAPAVTFARPMSDPAVALACR